MCSKEKNKTKPQKNKKKQSAISSNLHNKEYKVMVKKMLNEH